MRPRRYSGAMESAPTLSALEPLPGSTLAGRFRGVAADGQTWLVDICGDGPDARQFAHLDLSESMRAVLPPRPVPFAKRAMWRIVLGLLGTRIGRAVLAWHFERRAAADSSAASTP